MHAVSHQIESCVETGYADFATAIGIFSTSGEIVAVSRFGIHDSCG